jgi:hypothetical protein
LCEGLVDTLLGCDEAYNRIQFVKRLDPSDDGSVPLPIQCIPVHLETIAEVDAEDFRIFRAEPGNINPEELRTNWSMFAPPEIVDEYLGTYMKMGIAMNAVTDSLSEMDCRYPIYDSHIHESMLVEVIKSVRKMRELLIRTPERALVPTPAETDQTTTTTTTTTSTTTSTTASTGEATTEATNASRFSRRMRTPAISYAEIAQIGATAAPVPAQEPFVDVASVSVAASDYPRTIRKQVRLEIRNSHYVRNYFLIIDKMTINCYHQFETSGCIRALVPFSYSLGVSETKTLNSTGKNRFMA